MLVVNESVLNGFTFDGWNLSNLTIKAGAGTDDHFKGITFASNTVVSGLAVDSNQSFRNSPEAVFAGGVSNVTFTGKFALRYADELLASTDWNGAIIYADSGCGRDIGGINWADVDVDWSGATIYAGFRFIRDGSYYDQISWEGVTFNIVSNQIWRSFSSSAEDLGGKVGEVGRCWNNSIINAVNGGFFDCYNRGGFAGIYTFDGADVNGDLFKGASNNEIYQPTTVDFSGADVSDLVARDISGLSNLTVVYDPETTIFGAYTEQQAIADGWVSGSGPGTLGLLTALGFGFLCMLRRM